MTPAWLILIALAAGVAGFGIGVIANRRRIRHEQRELAELLDAADRAPPMPTARPMGTYPVGVVRPPPHLRRRTDALPDNIRHGRDRLIVIARRRPRP